MFGYRATQRTDAYITTMLHRHSPGGGTCTSLLRGGVYFRFHLVKTNPFESICQTNGILSVQIEICTALLETANFYSPVYSRLRRFVVSLAYKPGFRKGLFGKSIVARLV